MRGGDGVVSLTRCGLEEVLDNRTNSINHQLSDGGWGGGQGKGRGGEVVEVAASDRQEQQDQKEKSTHQILKTGSRVNWASAVMAEVYQ